MMDVTAMPSFSILPYWFLVVIVSSKVIAVSRFEVDTRNPCPAQNVMLTCVSDNSSTVTFTVSRLSSANKAELHSDIIISNDSVATTSVPVHSVLENETELYFGCKDATGEEKKTYVMIYDDPKPITNLSCVVNDWDVSMNCTWTPGANYQATPTVNFQWRIPSITCGWQDCSDPGNNYCHMDRDGANFSMKPMDILITITAYCGLRVTQCFTVNTENVVKPAPVSDIQSETINSTCVKVTWDIKRPGFTRLLKLTLNSRWGSATVSNVTGYQTTVCGLIPATSYSIAISTKPGPRYNSNGNLKCGHCNITTELGLECQCLSGEGYWSDQRSVTTTTYSAAPRVSPRVAESGWAWSPKDCTTVGGYRTVSVYWQPLDDIDKNGDLKAYVVTMSPGTDSPHQSASDSTHLTRHIPCNQGFTVTVQARNVNGISPVENSIIIQDSRKGVYPPEFVVEMSNSTDGVGNRTVNVNWGFVKRPDINGFTVFWCEREQGQCAKSVAIQWKHEDKHSHSTQLELVSPENYLFGVSMTTEAGNSGVTWGKCVYTKSVVPSRSPYNVAAQQAIENRALYVTWDRLTCVSGEPYVDKYLVQYCYEDLCDILATTGHSIVIRDLEAGVFYSVKVRGVSTDGRPGPWSEPIEEMAIDDGLTPEEIAALTFGSLFGFVIVSAAVVNVCRRTYRKLRLKFSPPPIADILARAEVLRFQTSDSQTGRPSETESLAERRNSEALCDKCTKHAPLLSSQFSDESGFVEGKLYSNETLHHMNGTIKGKDAKMNGIDDLDGNLSDDDIIKYDKQSTSGKSSEKREKITEIVPKRLQENLVSNVSFADDYVKSVNLPTLGGNSTLECFQEPEVTRPGNAIATTEPDAAKSLIIGYSKRNAGYITQHQAETMPVSTEGDIKDGRKGSKASCSQQDSVGYIPHEIAEALSNMTNASVTSTPTGPVTDGRNLTGGYVSHQIAQAMATKG